MDKTIIFIVIAGLSCFLAGIIVGFVSEYFLMPSVQVIVPSSGNYTFDVGANLLKALNQTRLP